MVGRVLTVQTLAKRPDMCGGVFLPNGKAAAKYDRAKLFAASAEAA